MNTQRVIGLDLGGTKIAAGTITRDGDVASRVEHPTPVATQEALLAGLDRAVEEVLDDDIAAIGLGIPSTIDQRSGRAVASVNIPLANLDLRARMATRFGLPVGIDNDANAATLAEWRFGAGRGASHLVMLTLGTGIGGGLVLNGRPYRGAVGAGAELGHMVVQIGGPRCQGSCTGHGHLEAVASGRAADRLAREVLGGAADAHALVDAAREGHRAAVEALAQLGRRLGAGIASLVNIFDPEIIVVGGGFAAAGDLLLGPAREVVAQEALEPARELVRIVPAALGAQAGLIGAGLVAFEALDVAAPPVVPV